MPARRVSVLVALAVGAVVGLTSCMPASPTPQASSAPATTAESDEAEAAPGVAYVETAPGAELAFGEPASIAFDPIGDGPQLVSVTVTGVREGSIADFGAVDPEQHDLDQLDGSVPMYVDIEMTKLEPYTEEIAFASIDEDFAAVDTNGASLPILTLYGTYGFCDSGPAEPSVDTGVTDMTCIIVVTRERQEFGGAVYSASDTPYDSVDGQPIVWR